MRLILCGVVLFGVVDIAMGQVQGRKPQGGRNPTHVVVSGVTIDGAWERVECKARSDGKTTVLTTEVKPMWIGDAVVYESRVGDKMVVNVLFSEFPIAVDMLSENPDPKPRDHQGVLHLILDEKGRVCFLEAGDRKGALVQRKFSESDKDGVTGALAVKEGRVSGRVEYQPRQTQQEGDWSYRFDLKIEGRVLTVAELFQKKQKMLEQEGNGRGVVLWHDEPQALRYAVAYQQSFESFGPVEEITVILLSSEPISVEAIRRGLGQKNHELHPELRGAHLTIRLNEKREMYGWDIGKYRECDGQNQIVGVSKEVVAGTVEVVEGRVRGAIQLDAKKWNKPEYNFLDVSFDAEIVKVVGDVAK